MRILQVISSVDPRGGGPIEGLKQQSTMLEQLGHDVEVVTCDDSEASFVKSFPLQVHAMGPPKLTYAFTQRLYPWLIANAPDFDAVIVNGLWQHHSFATYRAMKRLERPYVVFPHGMLSSYFRRTAPLKHFKKLLYWFWGEYRVLAGAAAVLFTTEDERDSARGSFKFYRAKERVVGYGTTGPVGDACFQASMFRREYPKVGESPFFLFLGRIHPIKGLDILIRAFAATPNEEGAQLVIAGPDSSGMRRQLQALTCELGIADRVIWTGMLNDDLKWGALQACSVFVLPSHHENFGVVVAEALACGKPVLISNKVSIWREVEAAAAGLVADDTQEGTSELLQGWQAASAEERERMSILARRCFEQSFEIGRSVQRLLEVLREVDVSRVKVVTSG